MPGVSAVMFDTSAASVGEVERSSTWTTPVRTHRPGNSTARATERLETVNCQTNQPNRCRAASGRNVRRPAPGEDGGAGSSTSSAAATTTPAAS